MAGDLSGRVAVVTGAGRGIGRAIAKTLARQGASVVVNDLGGGNDGRGEDHTPADAVVEEIREAGGMAEPSYDSVADFDAAGRIIGTAVERFGSVDILVNNAGISAGAPIWKLSPELFEQVVRVHAFGTYYCTRHACEGMRERGWGRVVNIVSRAGLIGSAGTAAYATGKGGIYGFTNAVSRDLAPFGITVNAVNPAATRTRMVEEAAERAATRGLGDSYSRRILAAAQDPESVAAAVAALCSDEAANVSGQTLFVQGESVGLFDPLRVGRELRIDGGWTPEALAEALANLDLPPLGELY